MQPAAFSRALACVSRAALADPVKESRALLAWLCGQGFSTLALEQDGHFQLIDIGPCLGKPAVFAAWQRKSWGRIDTPFQRPRWCAKTRAVATQQRRLEYSTRLGVGHVWQPYKKLAY
ncbi:hypothetical protein [Pseudomonas sp. Irchel 3E20]|uniref:hypothetical protein n=1 Tax=Pseudomonas sp. Irchel 3E20 TaxID=2008983 RepID=UPI00113FEFFE|nr:hypothetical protein [Pseudomonas sp. Irchel 3E20]